MLQENFEHSASPIYEFQTIGYEGLTDVLMLWDKVKKSLPSQTEHHLKPLTRTNLVRHSMSGYPILGLVDTSRQKLAAILLVTPTSAAFNEGYVPDSIADLPIRLQTGDAAIVQCVATDPSYARQGLMKILMNKTNAVAKAGGLSRLFSKVALDNIGSQNLFWSSDYTPVVPTTGQYGDKTYDATYFCKDVSFQSEGETIALRDVPVFNGSHVNDNKAACSSKSFCPV